MWTGRHQHAISKTEAQPFPKHPVCMMDSPAPGMALGRSAAAAAASVAAAAAAELPKVSYVACRTEQSAQMFQCGLLPLFIVVYGLQTEQSVTGISTCKQQAVHDSDTAAHMLVNRTQAQ